MLPVRQADGAGPKTRIRVPSHHPAHAAEISWITVRNPAEILQATPNLKYRLGRGRGQRTAGETRIWKLPWNRALRNVFYRAGLQGAAWYNRQMACHYTHPILILHKL